MDAQQIIQKMEQLKKLAADANAGLAALTAKGQAASALLDAAQKEAKELFGTADVAELEVIAKRIDDNNLLLLEEAELDVTELSREIASAEARLAALS